MGAPCFGWPTLPGFTIRCFSTVIMNGKWVCPVRTLSACTPAIRSKGITGHGRAVFRLANAARVYDSLLFHGHHEWQMGMPREDNIRLYARDLRRPPRGLGGAVLEQRLRRGGVAQKEPIAVNCARRGPRKTAQQRPLICVQQGFRVVLHDACHLPEGAGALWVGAPADRIVVVSLNHHGGIPADEIDHLAGIRTVVHQVAEYPQLVMRFRKDRLQRFEVGVNVGNDEKLHGALPYTLRTSAAIAAFRCFAVFSG